MSSEEGGEANERRRKRRKGKRPHLQTVQEQLQLEHQTESAVTAARLFEVDLLPCHLRPTLRLFCDLDGLLVRYGIAGLTALVAAN